MQPSKNYIPFDTLLSNLQLIADDLPVSIIIHHVHNYRIVYMNRTGLKVLGTTLEQLQSLDNQEYHNRFFNVDNTNQYLPRIFKLIEENSDERLSFFQEVRLPGKDGWHLYVSNIKIFARDEQGQPTHVITVASSLDQEHHISAKVSRLVEEAAFFRINTPLFLKLSRREREILRLMALGMASTEIAEKLFVSPATIDTHRKNIRNKLGLKNNYDAVKFAQAYNLV
jgi:DNA-binding CsgD family transcriptional regulator